MVRRSKTDNGTGVGNSSSGSVNTAAEVLTAGEIEAICSAYRDGCTGDVLIGLRGTDRVVTMSVPRSRIAQKSVERFQAAKTQIRRLKCDATVHVACVQRQDRKAAQHISVVVIAVHHAGRKDEQVVAVRRLLR